MAAARGRVALVFLLLALAACCCRASSSVSLPTAAATVDETASNNSIVIQTQNYTYWCTVFNREEGVLFCVRVSDVLFLLTCFVFLLLPRARARVCVCACKGNCNVDVTTQTVPGIIIMGGGTDVDDAFIQQISASSVCVSVLLSLAFSAFIHFPSRACTLHFSRPQR